MAFCPKCGAGLADGAAFCTRCGAAITPSAPAPMPPPPTPTPVAPSASGLSSNVAGLLTYLFGFITGIIFLVLEPYKNDRFVRFHAFQSIFFSVGYMIFWIIYSRIIVFGILSFGFLWTILSLIGTLISLAAFLYWLFLMYKAYNNERYMIPYIGELAAKQAG
jgi:uncharacterized membrane protein